MQFSKVVFSVLLVFLLSCGELLGVEVDPAKVAIILSRGRSGSTELTSVVSNIGKGEVVFIDEIELFGDTSARMARLHDPLGKMLSFLLEKQKQHPNKIVGFKWKPYHEDEKYQLVWEWFAKTGAKVIYNYRNPLDVWISMLHTRREGAVFNCFADQKDCIERQKSIKISVDVDKVIPEITAIAAKHEIILGKLRKMHINHFVITYEGVNRGTMTERLATMQKVADFLVPEKRNSVVVDESVFAARTAHIGHLNQNATVENYDQLVTVLRGTPYEHLLH